MGEGEKTVVFKRKTGIAASLHGSLKHDSDEIDELVEKDKWEI